MLLLWLIILHMSDCLSAKITSDDYDNEVPPTTNKPRIITPYHRRQEFLSPVYEEDTNAVTTLLAAHQLTDYEPKLPPNKDLDQKEDDRKIDCESFASYASNCTNYSDTLYNSSQKSPPMPAKVEDWCRAIRHLTNCAVSWNTECTDVTENHFNEESIKGHMHVVSGICDDEYFRTRYDELPQCIDRSGEAWKKCYIAFKTFVDEMKNVTKEWTHYNVHFELCCVRTRFRRCTLDALFVNHASKCTREEAMILQKYSVIISAGEVYQDCERNVMYANCPGGDPRPSTMLLSNLMNGNIEMRSSGRVQMELYEKNRAGACILSFVLVLFSGKERYKRKGRRM